MDKRLNRCRRRSAFTLIELLLVLVILAILVSVVALKFTGRSEDARKTKAQIDIETLGAALEALEIDTGRLPPTDEGLSALVNRPSWAREWKGPYIKKGLPVDPWGNPYIYRYPGTHNVDDFDLSSMGPDGQEGADDIINWAAQAGQ